MVARGPGDYFVVGPHANLLNFKVLPSFEELFVRILRMGKMVYHPHPVFTSYDGAYRVFFAHAKNPETLESATAKAAWLDEAGQDSFTEGAWEALQRRLAIHKGRILITTTPYNFNWLYRRVYLPWKNADGNHPTIDVIQFDSIANPLFPKEMWEAAKKELPAWKFDMFYRGRFTRPAGLIYDVFDAERHVRPAPPVEEWQGVVVGVDFGGTNFYAVRVAVGKDNALYVTSAYHNKHTLIAEHAKSMRRLFYVDGLPFFAYGGAKGEGYWRREFSMHGFPIVEPDTTGPGSVLLGIEQIYSLLKAERLFVDPSLDSLINEFSTYSWVVDAEGNPIVGEIDKKNQYHLLDALRYATPGALRLLHTGASNSKIVLDCAPSAKPIRARRRRERLKKRNKDAIHPIFDQDAKGVLLWYTNRAAQPKVERELE